MNDVAPWIPYQKFPKIPRLCRTMIVTEKIDGTNAQIIVQESGEIVCGSRNRVITPDADNYGFAAWVQEHHDDLLTLGVGRYYGEWWGQGIQRGYGLDHRRFSLFHTHGIKNLPACCHVVPVLAQRDFDTREIGLQLERLRLGGSVAAPGFMNPEGAIVYHTASGQMFKQTFEDQAKGTKHE